MEKFILRIRCTDQPGLIYKITDTLYKRGLNIINNAEHVDPLGPEFFMRTEVEGGLDQESLVQELQSKLPPQGKIQMNARGEKKLVLMVTKEAHCLGDLLVRCTYEGLEAKILAVIGNHCTLKPLVEGFDIPFHVCSHQELSRDQHESDIAQVLQTYDPDYIVLAKYMRILSPPFVQKFASRLINIHHSFLPAFIGARPYQQAYDRGVKIVGATAHFVTDALDEGPIISQGILPVTHAHSPEDMVKAGRDVEKITLAQAVTALVEDRVFIYGNKTIIF